MKMKKLNLIVLTTIVFHLTTSHANILQSDKGNGGDSCERRMLTIAEDFKNWFSSDSYKGIQLPLNLNETEYKTKMLDAIHNSTLNCTTEKLLVGHSEKTCKNLVESNGKKTITCNLERFNYTEESEKYKLLHHEYAGISGFETNNASDNSHYTISNQINQFLDLELQMKLKIKNEKSGWKSKILICRAEQLEGTLQVVFNFENKVTNVSLISSRLDLRNNPYILNFKKKNNSFTGSLGECNDQMLGGWDYIFRHQNGISTLETQWCNDEGDGGNYQLNLNCIPVN